MKKADRSIGFGVLCLICGFCYNSVAQLKHSAADILFARLTAYTSKCIDTCYADSIKVLLLDSVGSEIGRQKPDTAILLINQALKIAEKINWSVGIAQANNTLSSVLQIRGDNIGAMKRAFASITSWQELLQKQKDSPRYLEGLASAMGNLSTIYIKTGSFNEALSIFFSINEIFRNLGLKRKEAITLGNIGIVYLRLNEFNKSIEYSKTCLSMMEALKDELGVIRPLTNLGIAYKEIKNYDQSLSNLFKALEFLKRNDYRLDIARLMSNISNTYQQLPDYSKALDFAYQALEIDSAMKNEEGAAIRRIDLGSIYLDMGEYQKAEEQLKKGLATGLMVKNEDIEINAYQHLHKLYKKTGQFQLALDYYQKEKNLEDSVFNYRKMQDITRLEASNEFTKSRDSAKTAQEVQLAMLAAGKKIALAESDKKRSLEVAQERLFTIEADNKRELAETEKEKISLEAEQKLALSEADKKRGIAEANAKETQARFETAKEKTLRNFIIAATSLSGITGILIFSFYKRKRDADQKQKEAYLRLQISETEMKALRSQMSPHFIFNALQSIQTFLLNHQAADANIYLLKFSRLMRLVLENSQHSQVPLKDDLQALELYMQLESIRLDQPFTCHFYIDEVLDTDNVAIPPLILQPFIENAIWHGLQYKPGPGHINVSIVQRDHAIIATVADNGIGRGAARNIEQSVKYKNQSLGLKLTQERLNVLYGKNNEHAWFAITDLFTPDHQSAGTKVELYLPLKL